MSIIIGCQQCGKRFRVDHRHAGRSTGCPACGATLQIPIIESDSPPTAQPLPQPIAPPPPPSAPQLNITVGKSFNPGVAAVLSLLLPGLGQLYKGQPFNGLAWFVITVIGYFCLIVPGIVLHLCCILGAAMGDPYKEARKLARQFRTG